MKDDNVTTDTFSARNDMVDAIRASLEYRSIGRKLLMVDDLPEGALTRYERDIKAEFDMNTRKEQSDTHLDDLLEDE